MKCSRGVSNFLEELSNLSHSIVFLYFFALITEEIFLSAFIGFVITDQYKEIEENNRMGKIRDLFKKTRDSKGKFHAKMMSSIKDRNGMDLTETEDIMKRWQEYTEELYKK